MPAELRIAFALISTTTVVGGFIFAADQFVAFVRQRRQETALTLMTATQPPELFSRSVRKIFELPDDASPEAIHALGAELEQALIETFVKFENLGYLVYSRAIPLHMADDLIGGMVRLHGGSAADTSGNSARSPRRRSNGSSGCTTAWSNTRRRRTRASAQTSHRKPGGLRHDDTPIHPRGHGLASACAGAARRGRRRGLRPR